jgi:hypothetical protein
MRENENDFSTFKLKITDIPTTFQLSPIPSCFSGDLDGNLPTVY